MRLRIRGPSGQHAITVPDDATVGDLRATISEVTKIQSYELKFGYPPQPLELDALSDSMKLQDSNLKLSGERLIVSERAESTKPIADDKKVSAEPVAQSGSSTKSSNKKLPGLSLDRKPPPEDPPEVPLASHGATMVLRIMPDDNSCLFRAFNSAYLGDMDNMHELRSVIAQEIQADPETYSAIVLEKEPDEYCRWIQNPDAWGGQIELQILSKHFNVEICSVDVKTLRVDRYNTGQSKRCILVYSGIHYDVVATSPSDYPHTASDAPPEFDTKVFNADDEEVVTTAAELCKRLRGQGYFTDTASFNLKCKICNGVFTGEQGALEHYNETQHFDFGEVRG